MCFEKGIILLYRTIYTINKKWTETEEEMDAHRDIRSARAEERRCEDIKRRWPSTSQRKKPQQKPKLPTP